jgi:UDP-N-acetylmuramoyl-tripeptide--D-alanyl-D-alanine ligase
VMNLSLDDLVAATKGTVIHAGARLFSAVSTDSRKDLHGELFVALKGDVFDAHKFVETAARQGANGLLVQEWTDENTRALQATGLSQVTVVQVGDTLLALQDLARFWRRKMKARILGVTGTNGKTTTKEFTAALLATRFNVQYSKGSFNNHWGVPISLLSIRPEHDVAVIEMGMNHAGELTVLSKIAEPDVVMVTMVGRGHLEGMGSIEGVAKAKAEIYEHAPKGAMLIFNLDNPYTQAMAEKYKIGLSRERYLEFSSDVVGHKADVSLTVSASSADHLKIAGFIRGVPGESEVAVFGQHNVTNLMAAASFGLACGMTPEQIWQGLPMCKTAWGRNQWVRLQSGTRVLFDAYNANPESMSAAISNFKSLKTENGGRKIAILGEMREMGSAAPEVHRALGEAAAQADFDVIAFVGPSGAEFKAGLAVHGFSKKLVISSAYEEKLAAELGPVLDPRDIVLIKGSRGVQLERVLMDLKPIDFSASK